MLAAIGSAADVERMADKIVAALREPMRVLNMPLELSCSIGLAMFSGGVLSPAERLRRADQAMYAAKDAGRGCYRMA